MAKARSIFVCGGCGYQSPRWLGRCPDCGEWNTLIEEAPAAAPPDVRRRGANAAPVAVPTPFTLASVDARDEERLPTGLGEFDRVLGGGLVRGSVVLVGGEPGIGKSTLLLQTLLGLQQAGVATLLVSGEESAGQVKLRARRLTDSPDALPLICETEVEAVVACLEEHAPAVCVVDSVQTLWSSALTSAPGSVSQIREATGRLLRVAKESGITLVLVGHVTKSGDLAGPRVLEHMVDVVLAFEGDRGQPFRILRGSKNRFGATNEVGVFAMTGRGLEDVPDPSALFLDEAEPVAGSAVVAAIEGTPLPAGRGAGAGRAVGAGHASAGHARGRGQPAGDGRGGALAAGRLGPRGVRHLRQRRRRPQPGGSGSRSAGGLGGRVGVARQERDAGVGRLRRTQSDGAAAATSPRARSASWSWLDADSSGCWCPAATPRSCSRGVRCPRGVTLAVAHDIRDVLRGAVG